MNSFIIRVHTIHSSWLWFKIKNCTWSCLSIALGFTIKTTDFNLVPRTGTAFTYGPYMKNLHHSSFHRNSIFASHTSSGRACGWPFKEQVKSRVILTAEATKLSYKLSPICKTCWAAISFDKSVFASEDIFTDHISECLYCSTFWNDYIVVRCVLQCRGTDVYYWTLLFEPLGHMVPNVGAENAECQHISTVHP